jgi:hypothetical protein
MNPIEQIAQLEKQAEIVLAERANCSDIIPFCAEAISLMQSQPNLNNEFVNLLSSMSCPEFIAVCVHALRWPNLNQAVLQKYNRAVEQNDWRAEGALRTVVDAINPNWEDARDFYSDYFHNLNP